MKAVNHAKVVIHSRPFSGRSPCWPGCSSRRVRLPAGTIRERGPLARQIRQPVALVVVNGGKTLLVANRRSGSISVIDTASRRVVAEQNVGRGLAGLAVLPDGSHLLAVDQAANDLLLLAYHDRSIRWSIGERSVPTPSDSSSRPTACRASWPRSGRAG